MKVEIQSVFTMPTHTAYETVIRIQDRITCELTALVHSGRIEKPNYKNVEVTVESNLPPILDTVDCALDTEDVLSTTFYVTIYRDGSTLTQLPLTLYSVGGEVFCDLSKTIVEICHVLAGTDEATLYNNTVIKCVEQSKDVVALENHNIELMESLQTTIGYLAKSLGMSKRDLVMVIDAGAGVPREVIAEKNELSIHSVRRILGSAKAKAATAIMTE